MGVLHKMLGWQWVFHSFCKHPLIMSMCYLHSRFCSQDLFIISAPYRLMARRTVAAAVGHNPVLLNESRSCKKKERYSFIRWDGFELARDLVCYRFILTTELHPFLYMDIPMREGNMLNLRDRILATIPRTMPRLGTRWPMCPLFLSTKQQYFKSNRTTAKRGLGAKSYITKSVIVLMLQCDIPNRLYLHLYFLSFICLGIAMSQYKM